MRRELLVLLSEHSGERMMLNHITRDCLIIMFLSETEPRAVFVLDGESNEPHTDFPQPISQKMYLTRFRNELLFNGDSGTKGTFFPTWRVLCTKFYLDVKYSFLEAFDYELTRKTDEKFHKNCIKVWGVLLAAPESDWSHQTGTWSQRKWKERNGSRWQMAAVRMEKQDVEDFH